MRNSTDAKYCLTKRKSVRSKFAGTVAFAMFRRRYSAAHAVNICSIGKTSAAITVANATADPILNA